MRQRSDFEIAQIVDYYKDTPERQIVITFLANTEGVSPYEIMAIYERHKRENMIGHIRAAVLLMESLQKQIQNLQDSVYFHVFKKDTLFHAGDRINTSLSADYINAISAEHQKVMNSFLELCRLWTETQPGDMIRPGTGITYEITDDRIAAIKPLNLKSLTDEQNKKLTEQCRELLRHCKRDKLPLERAFTLSKSMRVMCEQRQIDASQSGNVKAYKVPGAFIHIHNHPNGAAFSPSDLYSLYFPIEGVVTNDGKTYFLERTEKSNLKGFVNNLKNCEPYEALSCASSFGINFYKEGILQCSEK